MNVTNLSTEERIRLFNEWLEFREKYKDLEDFSQDNLGYYLEGNDIYLTKEQSSDPNYKIPEWNESLPDWMIEESKNIGKRCKLTYQDSFGTFKGFVSSYADYYYLVELDNGEEKLLSCVGGLEFIE